MSERTQIVRAESLQVALRRLDCLLRRAVSAARYAAADPAVDAYAGLCVTEEEVETLLAREPLRPSLWCAPSAGYPPDAISDVAVPLKERLGLTDFELDVALLALAPELDLKYEKLFAFLNDDVTRKWPTADLALGVLCDSAAERLARYRHFAGSRLFPLGLLRSIDPSEEDGALLSRRLKLDPIVIRFLCGGSELDDRLRRFCTVIDPGWHLADAPLGMEEREQLSAAVEHARAGKSVRVCLHGPEGCGQQECAEAVARALGAQLLIADFSLLPEHERGDSLRLLLLHCRLFGQVASLRATHWLPDAPARDLLASYPGLLLVDGFSPQTEETAFVITVVLERPTYRQRRAYWDRLLGDEALADESAASDKLSSLFELSFGQIRTVVSDARRARRASGRAETSESLIKRARQHSSRELAARAELIEPTRTWCDLVLHEDATAQLRELCNRVRRRHRVLECWGFGRERRGLGVSALFVGASGTGKTMAAEIIARDLGLNLYRIDLSAIVSKYVGETEKNLECIFRDATYSNAILLFDEAEALFGKRSAVRDAHDRYANIEVAYLLQRLESYSGVAILTTNLSENLDPSFTRRLAYTVHFPFPGASERQHIWQTVWPPQAPLAADFEARWLAERFKLSGGNIRNIALAAACMVENEDQVITMGHILRALRREYHKMGKVLTDADCGGFIRQLQVAAS